jgi:hypothetical protein
VSDKASTCPNCAYPINKKSKTSAPENKEGCFLQTLNTGCMIVFIIIAFVVIIGIIGAMN